MYYGKDTTHKTRTYTITSFFASYRLVVLPLPELEVEFFNDSIQMNTCSALNNSYGPGKGQECLFVSVVINLLLFFPTKKKPKVSKSILYNNQINARALTGQLSMFYCASKLMEKSRFFWIIIYRHDEPLGMLEEHSKN